MKWGFWGKHWKSHNSVKGSDDQRSPADKGLFIRRSPWLSGEYRLARPNGRCFCCRRWRRNLFGHCVCKVSLVVDNWSDQWQAVWLREDRSLLLVVAARRGGGGRKQSCILSCAHHGRGLRLLSALLTEISLLTPREAIKRWLLMQKVCD